MTGLKFSPADESGLNCLFFVVVEVVPFLTNKYDSVSLSLVSFHLTPWYVKNHVNLDSNEYKPQNLELERESTHLFLSESHCCAGEEIK